MYTIACSVSVFYIDQLRERELTMGRIGNESRVLRRVEDPDEVDTDQTLEIKLGPYMCLYVSILPGNNILSVQEVVTHFI